MSTRYGMVRTDHILFIAAGAFHVSKPSDLIPEIQGRFPIRVEMNPLSEADFVADLNGAEKCAGQAVYGADEDRGGKTSLRRRRHPRDFKVACEVNENTENIGARRLHTIMEALLEDISFSGAELKNKTVRFHLRCTAKS